MPEFREVESPYPGLRPFESHEAGIFFGRERHTDRLLEILQRERFLVVIGPSGSGKSSLVRAGLLPCLTMGSLGSGSAWRIALLRPGDQPIGSLARALLQPDVFGRELVAPARDDDATNVALLTAELRRGPLGLLHATAAARERSDAAERSFNLLVLVDQFEELFTYAEASGERADESEAFVNLMLAARAEPTARVYVALTMRTDFLGNCVRFAELPEAINYAQYLTPRLTPAQMTLAIRGPAEVFGGSVEPTLVAELINTTGQNSDQLPLLQHALARMWARALERDATAPRICWDDASAIGGVAGALDQHAEAVLDGLLGAIGTTRAPLVEAMFCAITERRSGAAGGQDVRRPQTMARIAHACGLGDDWQPLAPIVMAYAAPEVCQLQCGRALGADSVIDLSHEALMRQWKRLSGWVADESRRGNDYRRWAERATEHAQGNSDLLEGAALARAVEWRGGDRLEGVWQPTPQWAERYTLSDDAQAEFAQTIGFIADSAAQAQRRIDEARERSEQKRRDAEERAVTAEKAARQSRLRSLWFAAITLIMVFMSAVIWAYAQRARALTALAEALAKRLDAQLNIAVQAAPRTATEHGGGGPARPITMAELAAIMPLSGEARRSIYLKPLNQAMAEISINTPQRQAHFLGQVSHESGQLRFVEELWGPTSVQLRYEPPSSLAARLGNTQPGDGKRYRGRGMFQLVGRAAYKKYGDALGLDLVNEPELAARPDIAVRTAAMDWKLRGMNELADADDLTGITRRISGGVNGIADRARAVDTAKRVLGVAPG